jgi:N-acetylglucosamine malate deacetylase 1
MKILAFGAHPDDIEIATAGTLIKYAQNGAKVHMVIATVPRNKDTRLKEAHDSAKLIGAKLTVLDIDPQSMIFSRGIVKYFDQAISALKPDIILTHWLHDSHQDHQIVTRSVIAASRKNHCSIYMYDQILPGGIVPETFRTQVLIDISKEFPKKIKCLLLHKSEAKTYNKKWIQGLSGRAAYLGQFIGTKHAEAFEAIKIINQL